MKPQGTQIEAVGPAETRSEGVVSQHSGLVWVSAAEEDRAPEDDRQEDAAWQCTQQAPSRQQSASSSAVDSRGNEGTEGTPVTATSMTSRRSSEEEPANGSDRQPRRLSEVSGIVSLGGVSIGVPRSETPYGTMSNLASEHSGARSRCQTVQGDLQQQAAFGRDAAEQSPRGAAATLDVGSLSQRLSQAVHEGLREILREEVSQALREEELTREDLLQALRQEFGQCARAFLEALQAQPSALSSQTSPAPTLGTNTSAWPDATRRHSSASTSSNSSRISGAITALQQNRRLSSTSTSSEKSQEQVNPAEMLLQSLTTGTGNSFSFSPRCVALVSQAQEVAAASSTDPCGATPGAASSSASPPGAVEASAIAVEAPPLTSEADSQPVPPPASPPPLGPTLLHSNSPRVSGQTFNSDPAHSGDRSKPLSDLSGNSTLMRKACLIGANRSAAADGAKPRRRLHKHEIRQVADLERHLVGELFRANHLLPAEGEDSGEKGSQPRARREHKLPSWCTVTMTRQTSKTSSKKSAHTNATNQTSHTSSSSETQQQASAPFASASSSTGACAGARATSSTAASSSSPSRPTGTWASIVTSRVAWSPGGNGEGIEQMGPPPLETSGENAVEVSQESYIPPRKAESSVSMDVLREADPEALRRSQSARWNVPTSQTLMRQRQEQELKATLQIGTESGGTEIYSIGVPTYDSELPSPWRLLVMWLMRRMASKAARALGLLPWSRTYVWTSTLYQWAVLATLSWVLASACRSTVEDEYSEDRSAGAVVWAMDAILAMGALLALLCVRAYWRSSTLRKCGQLLRAYALRAGAVYHWEEVSQVDFAVTALLWCVAVLLRAKDSVLLLEPPGLEVGYFAVSAAVLMAISSYVIHICRCLVKMADVFFSHIIENPDFEIVVQDWGLLQSLIRSACENIQGSFLALQLTMTAAVLLTIMQVNHRDVARLLGLLPGIVVTFAVIRTSVWAAAVTDKCARIPTLVNSLSVGRVLDPERMYCVQQIVHTQAGFYVYEQRLTSSTIAKTTYIACAMAFGLATQVL